MPRLNRTAIQRSPATTALVLWALLACSGCAELQSALDQTGQLAPPQVTLDEVELVSTPSQQMLRAYACPRVLEDRAGLGAGAALVCRQFFGPPPAPEAMKIGFDLHFDVANPNRVPLPLASLLTAVRVFPGQAGGELGATCVRLCAPDDAACAGDEQQDPCRAGATDVTDAQDVRRALGHMLIDEGIRLAAGGELEAALPRVSAGDSLALVARFALDPEAVLPIIEQLARQSLDEFQAGKPVTFALPYTVQGTLFADGGAFGRLAAPYGPLDGTFELPAVDPAHVAARGATARKSAPR